jgi:hypothetical protein
MTFYQEKEKTPSCILEYSYILVMLQIFYIPVPSHEKKFVDIPHLTFIVFLYFSICQLKLKSLISACGEVC